MTEKNPVSTKSLIAYALPAVPLSMLTMPLIVYIPPYYANEIGLSLTTVGLIFFLARAWDGVIDPLVGYWSDRTKSPWGRRKPWMAIGTPILLVLAYLLCQPPQDVNVFYLAAVIFFFYAAWTTVQIPYLSWGAELSRDYRERTRITGFREGGLLIGTLFATGLPLFIIRAEDPSLREILEVFVISIGVMLPLGVIIACFVTPSIPQIGGKVVSAKQAFAVLRQHGPFKRLLIAIFLFWLGAHIYNATVLFIIEYQLKLPTSAFLWFVFVQFVISTLMLPVVIKSANRFGKHRALAVGGMGFFVVLPFFLLVEPGNFNQALALYFVKGFFTAFMWVLPAALASDSVEYGMLHGGSDDAAIYMALYNFAQKMALATSVGIALPLAGALGFEPNVENTVQGMFGLNFVSLFLSGLVALTGAAILFNYPIDEKRHGEIRKELEERGIVSPGDKTLSEADSA